MCYFYTSRIRHTRLQGDWRSDVCSSDLQAVNCAVPAARFWKSLLQGNPGCVTKRVAVQIGRASCRVLVWLWGGTEYKLLDDAGRVTTWSAACCVHGHK